MLDKKAVSKAVDAIILYYGQYRRHRGEVFDDMLKTLVGISRSIENGHFDVKEEKDELI